MPSPGVISGDAVGGPANVSDSATLVIGDDGAGAAGLVVVPPVSKSEAGGAEAGTSGLGALAGGVVVMGLDIFVTCRPQFQKIKWFFGSCL